MINANEFSAIKSKFVGGAIGKVKEIQRELKNLQAQIEFKQKQLDCALVAKTQIEEKYIKLENMFSDVVVEEQNK